MKILHVVGARPNFMKVAPIMRRMSDFPSEFEQLLVHTGQHYDPNMSQVFFDDLGIPAPDTDLGVGSGSHAAQTADVMKRFEPLLQEEVPDWVIVVGDVNSTLAAALVSVKAGIPVAHVEAGLRSFDRSMPEEINRLLTDQLADLLFIHSPEAATHLRTEGISQEKIHFVGNVMIDSLARLLPGAKAAYPALQRKYGLDRYILVTLHRPANVDSPDRLEAILGALERISAETVVLFPMHPRTQRAIDTGMRMPGGIRIIDPLGYRDFLSLEAHAALVVTDSGGVQEETTYLEVPCLTVRPNTERPVTISQGTNRLVEEPAKLLEAMQEALVHPPKASGTPDLWDGRAAERIVDVFRSMGGSSVGDTDSTAS